MIFLLLLLFKLYFFSTLFIVGVHLFLYIVVILRGIILQGVITDDKTKYRQYVIGCLFFIIIYRQTPTSLVLFS